MKSFFYIVLLFLQFQSAAQSCATIISISTDSLKMHDCPGDCCYKLQTNNIQQVNFVSGFDSIQIFDARQLLMKTIIKKGPVVKNNFAETGICYCNTCQLSLMNFRLKRDSVYYLRVFGKKQLELTIKQLYTEDIPWFERKLTSGTVIDLETILFVGGLATFLPSSYSDLKQLERILKENPEINIKVMGHVNGPGLPNTRKNQKLSKQRAEAVVNYLVSKGINKARLTSAGYGNTKMVYPKPNSDFEMRRNRRVEILIR